MISFAETGPHPEEPTFPLGRSLIPLTQHWLQGTFIPGPMVPEAGLQLISAQKLLFTARMKPSPADLQRTHTDPFIEGLWRRNVVELFLGNLRTGRYLEVHLAPCFGWWSCYFTGVRQRETPHGRPLPLAVINHRLNKENTQWQGSVELDLPVICQALGVHALPALHANLTAIVTPQTGPIGYFSLAPLPGSTPDFHTPHAWLPLKS